MSNYTEQYIKLCNAFIAEAEGKQTKASAARMRKLSQQMNNLGPSFRKESVAANK